MTEAPRAPSFSLLLLDPDGGGEATAQWTVAVARGEAADLAPLTLAFEDASPCLAGAVTSLTGDFVWMVTPDLEAPDDVWGRIEAAIRGNPDAGVFTLAGRGLAGDDAWRGRRCRSHERNLESLRFASLFGPGALVIRRDLLLAALANLPAEPDADWWRRLGARLAARTRFVEVGVAVRRGRRLDGEPLAPGFAAPRPRQVLVLGQIEVSTSLYLDFLEFSPEVAVGFRPLTRLAVDAADLAAADLVILVRELRRFWDEGVIAFLDAAGIPYVYFTDDNFLALAGEAGSPGFYVPSRMRRALAGAREVWASTPALGEAMSQVHGAVRVWGPVLDPALRDAAIPAPGKLTIAVAGGDFRVTGLGSCLVGRLREVAAARPLRLVLTEAAAAALAPQLPTAEIVAMPMERSFRQFVRQWRRHGVDVLLHPAGATANAPFKCPTAVIVAGYLGAVPVVADEPAYEGWGEAQGILKLSPDAGELVEAAGLARDVDWRTSMGNRLAAALAERFSAEGRVARLRQALCAASPAGRSAEIVLGSAEFRRRTASLGLARATRWVRDLARAPG